MRVGSSNASPRKKSIKSGDKSDIKLLCKEDFQMYSTGSSAGRVLKGMTNNSRLSPMS